MEYIQRLPFMISALVALVVGLISYTRNESNQSIYMKMAICMVLSYLLGMYLRSMITRTVKEIEEKKKQEEMQEAQKEQKEDENSQKFEKADAGSKDEPGKASRIDLRIDKNDDEFEPLKVSRVIKSTLKDDFK